MPLVLNLRQLPAGEVRGVYVIGGVRNRLPARALYLHPAAADSFLGPVHEVTVVSDMFRSPESSLAAVRSGRGARPPGFSGHNYGLSIDIDVRATMRALAVTSKADLDRWMERAGWYCHRRDHQMTPLKGECHHFNFLGIGARISPKVRSTSGYLEAKIIALYGDALRLDAVEAQTTLRDLRMYGGDIDGIWGPLSREACRAFQRAWGLAASGKLDAATQRTLAYVGCQRRLA